MSPESRIGATGVVTEACRGRLANVFCIIQVWSDEVRLEMNETRLVSIDAMDMVSLSVLVL